MERKKATQEQINKTTKIYVLLTLLEELLSSGIKTGHFKQDSKRTVNRFIKFFDKYVNNFWNTMDEVAGKVYLTELAVNVENMEDIAGIVGGLSPRNTAIVTDFMKKLNNGDYEEQETVYNFGDVYLEFKTNEIMFALKDNLMQCNVDDISGYIFSIKGEDYTIVNIQEGGIDFLDKELNLVTFPIAALEIEQLYHFNNWVYENVILKENIFIAKYAFPIDNKRSVTFSNPYKSNDTKVVNYTITTLGVDDRKFGKAIVNESRNEYFYADTHRVYLADAVLI